MIQSQPPNTPVNATFYETNTGKTYYNTGSAWVGAEASRYGGVNRVYKIGATYYADKYDGSLITSSGTFETVLQASLNLGGTTYIDQAGTFTFNTVGVTMPTYSRLEMGYSTIISPPVSSSGFVCINIGKHVNNQVSHSRQCQIFGGRIAKNTGEQDWIGIELSTDGDTNGNSFAVIQDVVIYWPGTGIRIISSADGWCSNFNISRSIVYYPLIGVDFIKGGSRDTPFRAKFDDFTIQSLAAPNNPATFTQIGFKDVYYKDLHFYNCNVWDLGTPANQKTMTFLPGAFDIKIKGGTIARNDIGFRLEDYTTARGISIEADDWNLPTYGTEPMTQTIFVRNGRRKGGWEPSAGAGWGMVSGAWTNHAVGGAGTPLTIAYADGTVGHSFTTGPSIGNGAGIRFPKLITCRGWNPVYKIKFRLQSTSATLRRVLFGWLGSTTLDVSADDNLTALHGIGLGCRGADSTWRILSNNGTGGQAAADTGITIDTAMHTFELVGQDDITTNKWKYAIDGTLVQLPASDIPAQDAGLSPYAQVATGTGAAKGFDLFGIYVEST